MFTLAAGDTLPALASTTAFGRRVGSYDYGAETVGQSAGQSEVERCSTLRIVLHLDDSRKFTPGMLRPNVAGRPYCVTAVFYLFG